MCFPSIHCRSLLNLRSGGGALELSPAVVLSEGGIHRGQVASSGLTCWDKQHNPTWLPLPVFRPHTWGEHEEEPRTFWLCGDSSVPSAAPPGRRDILYRDEKTYGRLSLFPSTLCFAVSSWFVSGVDRWVRNRQQCVCLCVCVHLVCICVCVCERGRRPTPLTPPTSCTTITWPPMTVMMSQL